jgi:hypothetical protein
MLFLPKPVTQDAKNVPARCRGEESMSDLFHNSHRLRHTASIRLFFNTSM